MIDLLRSFTICVNYDDLLAFSLPTILETVDEAVVVTDRNDTATRSLALDLGAAVYRTDRFYLGGAAFNKGAALEEATRLFRADSWILLVDADTVLPPKLRKVLDADELVPGALYGLRRRLARTQAQYRAVGREAGAWAIEELPATPDKDEIPGYFQLFDGRALSRPWFTDSWEHAGGYDSDFSARFHDRRILREAIVHLGEARTNWTGRLSQRWSAGGSPTRNPTAEIAAARRRLAATAKVVGNRENRTARIAEEV